MKLKLLLLCCLFWIAGTAQNLVTVSAFSMPNNVPANTADWGNLTTLMVVAIANGTPIPSSLADGNVAFTIKKGGSKVCGGTLQTMQFTARTKTYKANDISGMLGGCVLRPGTYQLCVQFFANTNGSTVPVSAEKCSSNEFVIENPSSGNPTGDTKYSPPQNISPTDKKTLTDKEIKAPLTFRWTPCLPKPQDPPMYRLRVWQLMQGQNGNAAMKANTPVVEKDVRDITQFVKPNLMGDIEMIGGAANLVWNVEAVGEQGKVLGSSQPTVFSVSSGGGCQQSYDAKIDSITCLSATTYKLFGKINCYNSGYGTNPGYTVYPTKITLAQITALPSGTVLASSTTVPNVNESSFQSVNFSLLSVPVGTTSLILHFDTKVLDPAHNCIGEANDTLKLPNCACNPCKDKQTSFGKDSANFNNVGQVNSLNTVSHGPAKVIKVTAQIVDFERLGENGCMKCTKDSREFGNFIGGNLNGNGGIITKGNYGKQIQWQFSTPTTVSSFAYELNMMFPPLQEVSCCKDSIRVCTRWSFTDENCITCDTLICKVIVREYKKPTGPYYPGGATAIYAAQMAKMGEPYNSWYNQKSNELPANFNAQVNDLFVKSKQSENQESDKITSKEDLTESLQLQFKNIRMLKTTGTDVVWNIIKNNPTNTQCGEGTFSTSTLNTSEWSGAYGNIPSSGSSNNDVYTRAVYYNGFSPSIVPLNGSITTFLDEHSIVSYGNDPVVGSLLKTTSAASNNYSFRLGNKYNNYGTEMLTKKFIVNTDGIIKFTYALVLNEPGALTDPSYTKSAFRVAVYDVSGNRINNIVYLDGASPLDYIPSDVTSPFFQVFGSGNSTVVYRDWSCAKIDLSAYIGQEVSVALITNDCSWGGHYGYAYIDDWCGNCDGATTGVLNIRPIADPCIEKSPQVCLDYILPKIGATTGSGSIKLEFYQNGILVPSATLTSPTLTSGTTYCFTINPSKLPCNGKGYDVVATGNFMVGSTPITVTSPDPIGSPVVGILAGQNNDLYCCTTLTEQCCTNFVKTVSATTTMIGSTAAGYNTIKFLPTFTAGPKLIKKVVISIVNFETNSSNKECLTCESNTNNYGSMYVPRSFSGAGTDAIEGMSVASTGLLYSCVGCPPTWNTATNTHEVIWGSNSGTGYNLMDGTGDQSTTFFVRMPKKSTISCCDDTVKICVKYSFTDVDCKTCDTIICYKIINRQTVTNLSASTNGGSSSLARGVQPDGSNDSGPRIPVKGSLRKTDPPVSAPTTSGGTIPKPK